LKSKESSLSGNLAQKLRQLGDIAGNPPRLILAEQLGCRAAARAEALPLVGNLAQKFPAKR
jgi:hypothetical protein